LAIEIDEMMSALGRSNLSYDPEKYHRWTCGICVPNKEEGSSGLTWRYTIGRTAEEALCRALVLLGASIPHDGDLPPQTTMFGEPSAPEFKVKRRKS